MRSLRFLRVLERVAPDSGRLSVRTVRSFTLAFVAFSPRGTPPLLRVSSYCQGYHLRCLQPGTSPCFPRPFKGPKQTPIPLQLVSLLPSTHVVFFSDASSTFSPCYRAWVPFLGLFPSLLHNVSVCSFLRGRRPWFSVEEKTRTGGPRTNWSLPRRPTLL